MTKLTKKEQSAREEHREVLRTMLKPGDVVWTIIRSVAASNMSRKVTALAVVEGRIVDVTWRAAHAIGYTVNEHHELRVHGCGFDAGYEVVHNLGAVLWPNGTETPHGTRNGKPDSTGGYALKHERL
jgi:hypothetical protein